ncbi:MAG TPA: hypothetical protein HA360_04695 [Nanoarchaeota archaeon]|nr:hypothetical protein [Candidatus Woesearchaeota archaeon]HIH15776.1 hypothetical protein [Nanoarchaeota archaeon]HIH58967.1 hypothetical protein [Nanoarchaeota archaeon]HII14344.1 hypothetical protein [Nanoarchaeota archaeon]HIJ05236.1 hypothetical protein [Nanoarchaeota archaeon]
MIVILLGILDIIAALSIFTINFSWGPVLISFSILYLLAKSLPFLKSFASIMDIIVAGIFILALLGYANTIINALAALWLIQKGIMSLF